MFQKEPIPPDDFALRLVARVQAAIEEMISSQKHSRGRQEVSEALKIFASTDAIDQALTLALGLSVAAPIEVFLLLLAKHMAPDPKIIRRIEAKADILLEEPLRTGLDVLQIALKLPAISVEERQYRESRFRDAQRNLDKAWSLIEAKKARRMLSDAEQTDFSVCLGLLRAFCAAACTGGHDEARELSRESLSLLSKAEERAQQAGKKLQQDADSHSKNWEEILDKLEAMDDYQPSSDVLAQAREEDMGLTHPQKDDPTYAISPLAEYRWHYFKGVEYLSNEAENERTLAEKCETEARSWRELANEYHGVAICIKGTLLSLQHKDKIE